jgi:hypothetical protein
MPDWCSKSKKRKRCGKRKKRWSELSRGEQRAVVVVGTVQVTLLLAAEWDIQRRPQEQINGPKWLWRLLSLANFVGPIAYFCCGRRRGQAPET